MRIIIIVSSVVVAIACGALAYHYSQDSFVAEQTLNEERYKRMVAEESLQRSNTKISTLESEITRTTNKITSLEKLVEQTKGINQDLKARLDKAVEIKDLLEKKISELSKMTGDMPQGLIKAGEL